MTTAFQYIFDNAETISIDRKAVVAQTVTRDQTLRSVSRGGKVWRFDVKLPDGIPWSTARPYIEAIDYADRYTVGNVQINNAGYNAWLTPYQGNAVNSTGFYSNVKLGNTSITLSASPTISSGNKFVRGDLIQLGPNGKVYSVAADVPYTSNTVTLNRPIIDANVANVNLQVGPAVTWRVVCTELPTWTIMSRDQVSWSGSFKFMEYLL